MTAQDLLYADPRLVSFYDLENGWGPDTRRCLELARDAGSVLDLGCGTGLLAAELGAGKVVVGVDPAAAMLEAARARPGGSECLFIEGDARDVRLSHTFDLVVMTGHAFQVLLTREDRLAALTTIATHLAPNGRFIFDSRNPAGAEWREWVPELSGRTLAHPDFGEVRAWNDVELDECTGIVTYGTFYEIVATGEVLAARSRIAFAEQDEIAELCRQAGLEVEHWQGDWDGRPYEPTSLEIIPFGRLAPA
jgi:SAM-dependent methyltransferase